MITKMTGTLTRVLDEEARVEIGPFEYQVLIPEAVRRQIQLRTGHEITFHVMEYLEGGPNANRFIPRRIGFLSEVELEFFELFCTVEKIGVKKALKAMARPVREIAEAIQRPDTKWLSTLPGIGATTAEQIVTTLKRKITPFLMTAQAPIEIPEPVETAVTGDAKATGKRKQAPVPLPASDLPDGRLIEDVYEALMGLGLNPVEARTKLDSLLTSSKPFKTLEEALTIVFSTKG
jgi:holliday junction DNA helicase RuvA